MPIDAAAMTAIFEGVLKKLAVNATVNIGKGAIFALKNVNVDYGEHLRQSYERCTKIRTILNSDESVDLLSMYVNLSFYDGERNIIEDYDFIDKIFEKKKVVVTGHGGSGKTVFMKYLWISLFEARQSNIPIFIELRRFNEITSEDFMLFMYRSVVGADSDLQQKDFEKALKTGVFTIIFDAFDEISTERKSLVELEINRLVNNNKDLVVVLSSRYDERFNAWQSFSRFHVCPLAKKQVIDLINKITYNIKTKRKFIKEIQQGLYEKHKSFLSSPLLATMMLVTFDRFAEIPDNVYLYYEQAFDTLFAHHDATKEAYKRKGHAGLSIDKFKKVLSYFCLISYYDAKIEFTDEELRIYLEKTFRIVGMEIDYDLYILDLKESVCILQKDGMHWTYTHRSFQEYFSAYCLTNFEFGKMSEILSNIVNRDSDTVLKMAFEMKRELVEEKYIIPNMKNILDNFVSSQKIDLFKSYVSVFSCVVCVHRNPTLIKSQKFDSISVTTSHSINILSHGPKAQFVVAVRKLYKSEQYSYKHVNSAKLLTDEEVKEFSDYMMEDLSKYKIFYLHFFLFKDIPVDTSWMKTDRVKLINKKVEIERFYENSSGKDVIDEILSLRRLYNKILKEKKQKSKNIDEIFSLGLNRA